MIRSVGRRAGPDRGQATVELALVLPLITVFALLIVQVGLVVRLQVLVIHAAREAARAASVDPDPQAARSAAVAGGPLDGDRIDVVVDGGGAPGSRVHVEVEYRAPTAVPIVGALVGDITLVATATMRVE